MYHLTVILLVASAAPALGEIPIYCFSCGMYDQPCTDLSLFNTGSGLSNAQTRCEAHKTCMLALVKPTERNTYEPKRQCVSSEEGCLTLLDRYNKDEKILSDVGPCNDHVKCMTPACFQEAEAELYTKLAEKQKNGGDRLGMTFLREWMIVFAVLQRFPIGTFH